MAGPKPARKLSHNEDMAARSREQSAHDRDIAPLPPIKNLARRRRCRDSLLEFCTVYNPSAFSLTMAGYQIESIHRLEEAVRMGALYAMAEPRGGGKTTRLRMAALWALANGYRRYVFAIGSTDTKAGETIDSLKMFMRFLPEFSEDYPEISYPIQRLDGIANRARGQTCGGVSTLIEWTASHIVLPTVEPPKKWPRDWPLRPDGMVPTSGAVVAASGLTGEGIRGSLRTLTTGEQIRPDLVLLDDPQTTESAASLTQNEKRISLIGADVLGMAGPAKSISAMMACTIIRPGDAMDEMTDPKKNPLWRGSRTGMLTSLPSNLEAWDHYFEVYHRCALKEPPDFTEANAYYAAHRSELDAGTSATWPERMGAGDVSAIQHAMNLYSRNRAAFMAEYMNAPMALELGAIDELDAAVIVRKLNQAARGTCPPDVTRLTAFVDVGSKVLWWCVVGWTEGFGGHVIDYGTYPEQRRSVFAASDARPSLEDLFPKHNEDARVYAGVRAAIDAVCGRTYQRDLGGELRVERCLVDSGKWPSAVASACRQSPHVAALLPSKGWGVGSGRRPMSSWTVKEGQRRGDHWILQPNTEGGFGRLLIYDANHWKSFTAKSLHTAPLSPGCLQLFGNDPAAHRLFAAHLTSEYRSGKWSAAGDQVAQEVWSVRPDGGDNHWWDTLVGCAVAASFAGLAFSPAVAAGDTVTAAPARQVIRLSDLQEQKRRERMRR